MRHVRLGHSLPELLVALALSGALCALLATSFITHQHLVTSATSLGAARTQARQAADIITTVVRPTADRDLLAVQDTLIDFQHRIAGGIACLPFNGSRLVLTPDTVARGEHLAGATHSPQPGDIAHVFDAGPLIAPSDDRWISVPITSAATLADGCAGSPFLQPVADAGHRARVLGISWPGAPPPPAGAMVHVTRRTRLYLYPSATGRFLGASDFDATLGRWSTVQPISGPYAALRFVLLDSTGGVMPPGANPATAAALALQLRSLTTARMRLSGMRGGFRSESLAVLIALRNR